MFVSCLSGFGCLYNILVLCGLCLSAAQQDMDQLLQWYAVMTCVMISLAQMPVVGKGSTRNGASHLVAGQRLQHDKHYPFITPFPSSLHSPCTFAEEIQKLVDCLLSVTGI